MFVRGGGRREVLPIMPPIILEKQMNKFAKSMLAVAVLSVPFATQAESAIPGELSANAGFVTDYYFRGSNLGDGGAYAGVDYNLNGIYLGTWIIDDQTGGNDGLETDFYLGYGLDITESVSFSAGYTRYEYTYSSDFEHEINLNLGLGAFALEYSFGKDEDLGVPETDYDFTAVSWSGEVFSLTYGDFDNSDTDDGVSYIELAASGEVSGVDVTVTLGDQIDVQTAGVPGSTGNGYLILDIGKSFDL